MKKTTIACVLAFLVTVLICLNSFGDDKEKFGFYVPKDSEEICGTWVNTTYAAGAGYGFYQKWVLYNWGYWEGYYKLTAEFSDMTGTFILVDKWTDSEGNIWYKEFVRQRNNPFPSFELDKISKIGTVWEYVFSYKGSPTADNMNPKNPYYRIYYRESDTE